MRVGKICWRWRINEGKSQRECAAQIGISESAFARFENGEKINAETLVTLLHWLLADEQAKEEA